MGPWPPPLRQHHLRLLVAVCGASLLFGILLSASPRLISDGPGLNASPSSVASLAAMTSPPSVMGSGQGRSVTGTGRRKERMELEFMKVHNECWNQFGGSNTPLKVKCNFQYFQSTGLKSDIGGDNLTAREKRASMIRRCAGDCRCEPYTST